ncbi:MAG: hypothetical protein VKJ02_11165 [Snowella sp.]|nr:hypothetical protein [Snowella sp.]
MDTEQNKTIKDALASRVDFFKLIIVGILLALGINLISSALDKLVNIPNLILLLGAFLVLASLAFFAFEIFGTRKMSRTVEAMLIYSRENNSLIAVNEYSFSEEVTRTMKAIFTENKAFQMIWEKEPLVSRSYRQNKDSENLLEQNKQNDSSVDTESPPFLIITCVEDSEKSVETKSSYLLKEIIEFVILDRLSTHLTDYFAKLEGREIFVKEYLRDDMPTLLLENRILALLSSPLETRAPFSEFALSKNQPNGEIHLIIGQDGATYRRFNLVLPKGSTVFRPEQNVLCIENNRLSFSFKVEYSGASYLVPNDFLFLYAGTENIKNIDCKQITIHINAELKKGALLLPKGWSLYQWVDSFLDSITEFSSFDLFLEKINWNSLSAYFYIQARLRERRTQKLQENIGQEEVS